ncbi:hypothetical protein LXL04_020716 [Taraxacum kok-saghyz]
MLTDEEFNAVHTYILLNEDQMQPYIEEYEKLLEDLYPDINGHDLAVEVDKHFSTWFENHAREKEINNKYIYDLSRRPLRSVKSYKVYFVNGYKFHTDAHSENKASMNSGVCISSEVGDYYGKILEILEVEYPGFPRKSTFVFKCDWYDPTDNVGVKVHKQYKLVDINLKRKFSKFEPFVLAMQPTQVCFMPYPSLKQNNTDWMAVFKVKPRGWTDVGESDHQKDVAFQEDEVIASEIISNTTEAFEYDDSSSNGSDDDITNDAEGDFDDANDSGDDGIADSEGSFEYSTSDNEEEVEEEDECDDTGFDPVAVICEVVDDDGSMARLPKLKQFVKKETLKIISIADLIRFSLHIDKVSATDDTRFVKHATDKAAAAPQKPKGKQNRKIPKKSAFKSSSVPKTPSMSKTSKRPTNFSAHDFRSSLKKMWVQKKASPEPRKIKQVWIVKCTSIYSDVKTTKEVKEKFQNQKFQNEKRRIHKSYQRYHQAYYPSVKFMTCLNQSYNNACFLLKLQESVVLHS